MSGLDHKRADRLPVEIEGKLWLWFEISDGGAESGKRGLIALIAQRIEDARAGDELLLNDLGFLDPRATRFCDL
jgi:hypothetical protein